MRHDLTQKQSSRRVIAVVATASAVLISAVGLGIRVQTGSATVTERQPVPAEAPVVGLAKILPISDVVTVSPPFGAGDARLQALFVEEGDMVREGQVLGYLDSRDTLAASEASALANLHAMEALLAQTMAQIDAAEKEARATLRRAEIAAQVSDAEYERWKNLYRTGFVSDSALDQHRLTHEQAKTDVERATAALLRYRSAATKDAPETLTARRNLDVARAEYQRLKAEQRKAEVRSPMNGQVLSILTRVGERPGSEGILRMGQTERMRLDVEVHQSQISSVRVGDIVEVSVPNQSGSMRATVTRLGLEVIRQNLIDSSPAASLDARVFKVTAELDAASSELARRYVQMVLPARIHPAPS